MGLSIIEQETSISYMRDSDLCEVYTSDTTEMTRLDKLAADPKAPHWKLKEEHRTQDGDIVGKTYITNKGLISYRRDFKNISDEQRQAASERFKQYHESKRIESDSTTNF